MHAAGFTRHVAPAKAGRLFKFTHKLLLEKSHEIAINMVSYQLEIANYFNNSKRLAKSLKRSTTFYKRLHAVVGENGRQNVSSLAVSRCVCVPRWRISRRRSLNHATVLPWPHVGYAICNVCRGSGQRYAGNTKSIRIWNQKTNVDFIKY